MSEEIITPPEEGNQEPSTPEPAPPPTPTYTSDWHSANIPRWNRYLEKYKGVPCRYLEIGAHEGRSSIWMMNNILTNSQSYCYCIDVWRGEEFRRRFMQNILFGLTKNQSKRFDFVHDSSLKELPRLMCRGDLFDIIYIDGQHHSDIVLQEFAMCWNVLRVGGILIFDDYLYKEPNETPIPMKDGIDNILKCFTGKYEVVESFYQMIIRKIK